MILQVSTHSTCWWLSLLRFKPSLQEKCVWCHVHMINIYLLYIATSSFNKKHFVVWSQVIESLRYCPILPMVLVNGAEGIGVGWSTSIPNYNPRDIIRHSKNQNRGGRKLANTVSKNWSWKPWDLILPWMDVWKMKKEVTDLHTSAKLVFWRYFICVFPKIRVPQNGWFTTENRMNKWMFRVYPYFWFNTHLGTPPDHRSRLPCFSKSSNSEASFHPHADATWIPCKSYINRNAMLIGDELGAVNIFLGQLKSLPTLGGAFNRFFF